MIDVSIYMRRNDFFFNLPKHLIAQYPSKLRTGNRLLLLGPSLGQYQDLQFIDFPSLLTRGDLLVFNNTRVIPARLFGHKTSGGKVNILVERVLDEKRVQVQIKARKAPLPGSVLHLEGDVKVVVSRQEGRFFELQCCDSRSIHEILQTIGHIPLPPYIQREDQTLDVDRYQTVYAKEPGAVAAPTAGLHFDENMLESIRALGVEIAFVTLHIGAGTFASVKVEEIAQHVMHTEYVHVSEEVCRQVEETKKRQGRVVAVGTTSVRALETASREGHIKPFHGETQLFITPGYSFHTVDALLTNFHLPESTLLMLVCALGGYERMLAAYHHAVEQAYQFFSFFHLTTDLFRDMNIFSMHNMLRDFFNFY